MKQQVTGKKILLALVILIYLSSHAQQQFIHTATKENISCNYDCTILDVAELNNNPAAVIFVTPVLDKGTTQNPHPIGSYYFKTKWHIFNLDNKPIPAGSKFNVEYFASPDETHFQYSFTRADIQADGSAFIDNWHLNNNPTVRFTSFLSWNPATQGAITNREETTVQYNPGAGKWFVSNNNNKHIAARVTYNISISGPGRVNPQINPPRTSVQINELNVVPIPDSSGHPCKCPASLPPNGQATGDLAGMYPNPMVAKILNRPLSNTAPAPGQVLKWNGTEWSPANETGAAGNNTTYTAGLGLTLTGNQFNTLSSTAIWNASQLAGRNIMTTAPTVGQVLKWNGNAWIPADDNVSTGNAPTPANIKPTFLYYTQTAEAQVNGYNKTATIAGLDNKFFTLSQSSRVILHLHAWVINTNTTPFAGGSLADLRVEILSNTSNTVVAWAASSANLFPNVGETVNATGFGILPAGTYYTRATIGRHNVTDVAGFRSGMSDKLLIEIFPD